MELCTSDTHTFAWNPEGTLARWRDDGAQYNRVYSYDEGGRLLTITRDYRNGNQHSRNEYRYNSDGVRVWEREWYETQDGWRSVAYQYLCGIGCGGVPLAIYRDEAGSDEWAIWSRYEWNTELLNGYWYEGYEEESVVTWRNLAVGLLVGDFLVADVWIGVWG